MQVLSLIQGAVAAGSAQGAGTFNIVPQTSSGMTIDAAAATAGFTNAIYGVVNNAYSMTCKAAHAKVGTLHIFAAIFRSATTSPVPIGGKIVIALPFNHFSFADISKANTIATGGAV